VLHTRRTSDSARVVEMELPTSQSATETAGIATTVWPAAAAAVVDQQQLVDADLSSPFQQVFGSGRSFPDIPRDHGV